MKCGREPDQSHIQPGTELKAEGAERPADSASQEPGIALDLAGESLSAAQMPYSRRKENRGWDI